VWYIFTKEVPLDKLAEIREMIGTPVELPQMRDRVTQLTQMGGVSVPVGG
jgi:hypothetical protein